MGNHIGLHISRGAVFAARLETTGKKRTIADSFSHAFEDEEGLSNALRECATRFSGVNAEWAVGIPSDECSFRHLKFPFNGASRIRAALPFELESALPYSTDEIETSFLEMSSDNEGTAVLACAARHERLDYYRTILNNCGVRVGHILPDSAALAYFYRAAILPTLLQKPGSALIASVDDRALHLCFMGPNGFVDTFVAEPEEREATRFLATLEQPPEKIFIGGPSSGGFLTHMTSGDFWKRELSNSIEGEQPDMMMVPLGLALFLETGEEALSFPGVGGRRMNFGGSLRFAAIGALTCALLFTGFLFFRNLTKERALENINTQTKAAFNAALPGAKAVKPVFQLEQQMKRLENRLRRSGFSPGGRADFLWILKRLSETVPDNLPVEMDEIVYEETVITITGKTDKYESVTRLRELYSLASPFRGAEVLDSKTAPDGRRVGFKIRIQL